MRTSRPARRRRPHARQWLGAVVAAMALAVATAGPASAATASEVVLRLGEESAPAVEGLLFGL